MGIVDHKSWDLSEKGKKDAERHRQKIDEHIRKNVRDVIAEESIITKKKGRKVRIPIKGLKDYRFIYGGGEGGGVGQGKGKSGDVIGRKQKNGQGEPGKPGNKPGEDYMETEVDIDYLINIMFEDLGLPYIEEKTKAHTLVPKGWKFESISKKGIFPRIHKVRTLKETIKRTMGSAHMISGTLNCEIDDALRALAQAKGDIDDAINIIKNGKLDSNIDPNNFHIDDDDLRFKKIEDDVEIHSNAVVLAMMDTSGSMTTDKKYIARSMLFWMVEFLKKTYDHVQIKFIVHTTDAKVVDEDSFFHKMESGGTYCSSAFELANYIIDTEYPVNEWNVYSVYISDGEDFDVSKTINQIKEMIKRKVNMIAYCEVNIDESNMYPYSDNTLLKGITDNFKFNKTAEQNTDFYKNDELHFLACILKNKTHIFPALKHILFSKEKK